MKALVKLEAAAGAMVTFPVPANPVVLGTELLMKVMLLAVAVDDSVVSPAYVAPPESVMPPVSTFNAPVPLNRPE